MRDLGVDVFTDYVSLNAVNCRPVVADANGHIGNRPPVPHEVACCRVVMVKPALSAYQPHVVILMGGSAVSSVIGGLLARRKMPRSGVGAASRSPAPASTHGYARPFIPPTSCGRQSGPGSRRSGGKT